MYKKILFIVWVVVISGAGYYFYTHDITVESLRAQVIGLGYWGILAYIVAYTIRPLVFFPTSIMTPLAAVLFGPYLGWIFTYIGENFSAVVAFLVARYFGRNLVKTNENKLLKKFDKHLTHNGFETVLLLRLVPLFPFDFVNYSSGLSGIRLGEYVLATMLGVLPGLTAYIFLGGSLTNPWLIIPTVIAFAVLIFTARYLKKKYGKKFDLEK